MMFKKAVLFGDNQAADEVLEADSPGKAKSIGRSVQGFDSETWDANRWDIVVNGSVHKFEQNSGLKSFLLGTGDRVLVESSPVDSIWGIGMEKSEAILSGPREWRGMNLLGFALMEARSILRSRVG